MVAERLDRVADQQRVRIEQKDVASPGPLDACVVRPAEAEVFVVVYIGDAAVACEVFAAAVRRGVVHQDDFEVDAVRLLENAVDAFGRHPAGVVVYDDDRNVHVHFVFPKRRSPDNCPVR